MQQEKSPQSIARREAPSLALVEVRELAKELQSSGLFPGITAASQAVAKILMGEELGVGPITALQLIDVVKGRLRPRAQLIAGLVKRSGRYDYTIALLNDQACTVVFTDRGKEVFRSTWTMEDAKRAGVVKPDSGWVTYPREMLFARAFSVGASKVCPEVMGGYEPLEGNGLEVVEGEVVPAGDPPASAWANFWSKTKEQGYAEADDVHKALGVLSVKDWLAQGKSLEEALARLEQLLQSPAPSQDTKAAETTPSPVPDLAPKDFLAELHTLGVSPAGAREILQDELRKRSGDGSIVVKSIMTDWVGPGGQGRTLADALAIIRRSLKWYEVGTGPDGNYIWPDFWEEMRFRTISEAKVLEVLGVKTPKEVEALFLSPWAARLKVLKAMGVALPEEPKLL